MIDSYKFRKISPIILEKLKNKKYWNARITLLSRELNVPATTIHDYVKRLGQDYEIVILIKKKSENALCSEGSR